MGLTRFEDDPDEVSEKIRANLRTVCEPLNSDGVGVLCSDILSISNGVVSLQAALSADHTKRKSFADNCPIDRPPRVIVLFAS